MPMYNYTCADCGDTQELIVSIAKRDDLHDCESCGGPLERHRGRDAPNQNVLRSANRDRMHLLKEQLTTRQQMYNLPPEEREQYEKHIEKAGKARQKESKISDKEDFHKANSGIDITK